LRDATTSDQAIAERQIDPSPTPEEEAWFTQRRRRLLAVIAALPEDDQDCLRLRAEGLRYREIATVLGISLGAVSISLTRSVARLIRAGGDETVLSEDFQRSEMHLSDQDLLLSADGELPARRAAQVRAHLAACWDCRSRMAQLEETIADFVRVRRRTLDAQLPPIAGPRSLLQARLAELSAKPRLFPGGHFFGPRPPRG